MKKNIAALLITLTLVSVALLIALALLSPAHAQEGVKSGDSEPVNPAWVIEPDASYQAYVERVERIWVGECVNHDWMGYWLVSKALDKARVCLRALAPEIHPDVEATMTPKQKAAARAAQDHANFMVFEIGKNKQHVTHLMHHNGISYRAAVVIPQQLRDAL